MEQLLPLFIIKSPKTKVHKSISFCLLLPFFFCLFHGDVKRISKVQHYWNPPKQYNRPLKYNAQMDPKNKPNLAWFITSSLAMHLYRSPKAAHPIGFVRESHCGAQYFMVMSAWLVYTSAKWKHSATWKWFAIRITAERTISDVGESNSGKQGRQTGR